MKFISVLAGTVFLALASTAATAGHSTPLSNSSFVEVGFKKHFGKHHYKKGFYGKNRFGHHRYHGKRFGHNSFKHGYYRSKPFGFYSSPHRFKGSFGYNGYGRFRH